MAQNQTAVTKATEKQGELGKTIISDLVVAKIAGIAAREIEGVYDLVTQGVSNAISGLAKRVTGGDVRGKGVDVEVGQREAAIDLKMVVHYGVNIPEVAEAVRKNIVDRIKKTTGLTVCEVNIDVTDLYFPEEDETPERRVE